jgi:hypothetical protein
MVIAVENPSDVVHDRVDHPQKPQDGAERDERRLTVGLDNAQETMHHVLQVDCDPKDTIQNKEEHPSHQVE